jgi:N6-adenosine-specific RNA methylase IME4
MAELALPVTPGGWPCIIGDPPWPFRDKGSRASPDWRKRTRGSYRTMAVAEIAALPVRQIVAPAAHLYLWTTDAHLLDGSALEVIQAWGFTPKHTLSWTKVTPPPEDPRTLVLELGRALKTAGPKAGLGVEARRLLARARRYLRSMEGATAVVGGRLQLGLGHYYRHAHELVILAVRGRAPALRHDLATVFLAPRGEHSAKPSRLHELAELMSPGPRLELFARQNHPGWTCWGEQCPDLHRRAA